MSHDPSEIILICWFKQTIIITNTKVYLEASCKILPHFCSTTAHIDFIHNIISISLTSQSEFLTMHYGIAFSTNQTWGILESSMIYFLNWTSRKSKRSLGSQHTRIQNKFLQMLSYDQYQYAWSNYFNNTFSTMQRYLPHLFKTINK